MNPDIPLRIGVMGGAEAPPEALALAEAVGRGLARAGAVLLCGGYGGVMEAAARGACEAGGMTVGILRKMNEWGCNDYIRIPLPTCMDRARNVINVTACNALIAIDGREGTFSEIAFAVNMGAPVVGLLVDAHLCATLAGSRFFERVETAEAAVERALALAAERRRKERP